MPNMYARGILFGKMVIELGDTCTARCEKLGMTADIEFRTKVHHLSACSSQPPLPASLFVRFPFRGPTGSNPFLRTFF